ncbi:MAG: anaerobic ribonucleoside-triphosphate reductase [Candidatus Gracilibacteria bacterium]|jgi:anaerobic ribonucleoside-triphosphate reductase
MSAFFIDCNGNTVERTKCEIYTRVMGYYRPVSQFNNGKKSEFYTRTYFDEAKSDNSCFMTQYGAA